MNLPIIMCAFGTTSKAKATYDRLDLENTEPFSSKGNYLGLFLESDSRRDE